MSEPTPTTDKKTRFDLRALATSIGKSKRTIIVAGLTAFLILVAGITLATRRALQSREAREAAFLALAAMDANQWDKVVKWAVRANELRPNLPVVLEMVAEANLRTGGRPEESIRRLDEVDRQGKLSLRGLRTLIRACLKIDEVGRAREAFDRVPRQYSLDEDGADLAIRLWKAEGRTDAECSALLSGMVAEHRSHPMAEVLTAVSLANNPMLSVAEPGFDQLWQIARAGGDPAILAIRALSTWAGLKAEQAMELRRIAREHPRLPLDDQMLVASVAMRLNPDRQARIVAEEMEDQIARDTWYLRSFVFWLIENKSFDEVLELFRRFPTQHDDFTFLAFVDAMGGAGKWNDLKVAAGVAGTLPVPDPMRLLILAQCELKLDPRGIPQVRALLQRALRDARDDAEFTILKRGIVFATDQGFVDDALLGYELLAGITEADERRLTLAKAAEYALQNGRGASALNSLEQLCAIFPVTVAHQEQRIYLSLLLNTHVEAASETARAEPDLDPLLRAMLADRLGDAAATRDALARCAEGDFRPPGQRAVLAGLWEKWGDTGRAVAIAERVPSVLLLDEEKTYLNKALGRATAKN